MYVGRDLSQLGMMSKDQWKDTELAFFIMLSNKFYLI